MGEPFGSISIHQKIKEQRDEPAGAPLPGMLSGGTVELGE